MKAYIYKITDNTNGDVYYGSTIESVSHRMAKHRYKYKLYKSGLSHFVSSYLILDNNDYDYECIEEMEVDTKQEMLLREKWYIQNNECVNCVSPIETEEEYRQRHRISDRKYYQNNKEKFKQYAKEYDLKNKDKVREYRRKYNIENRDRINERRGKKIVCECGMTYTYGNRLRHFKAKRHLDKIQI